jgi:hypothetical protein
MKGPANAGKAQIKAVRSSTDEVVRCSKCERILHAMASKQSRNKTNLQPHPRDEPHVVKVHTPHAINQERAEAYLAAIRPLYERAAKVSGNKGQTHLREIKNER